MPRKLPVVEIFGPTIAGEGHIAGQQTHFIRLGLCDYRCSWCDSMHAVLPKEVQANAEYLTVEEVTDRMRDMPLVPWVTISGGNPVLHSLGTLVYDLQTLLFRVNIETQGSIWQDWLHMPNAITVSPKPPSSGMDQKLDHRTLRRIMDLPTSVLKIVAFDADDLDWARETAKLYENRPLYLSIGTDPGDTRESLLERYRQISETVLHDPALRRAAVLPQMHVLLWGHALGV